MAEHRQAIPADVSLELTAEARHLAGARGASVEVLLFGGSDDTVQMLGRQGADLVHRLDAAGLDLENTAAAAAALERLVAEACPRLVMFADTRTGSELAGRLAARMAAPLLSRCTRLTEQPDGSVQADRPVYASRATATVSAPGDTPVLATAAPGVFGAGLRPSGAVPPVNEARLPPDLVYPAPVRVEDSWRVSPWEMDLEEAETIVAGGLGLARRADFDLLARLAGALGGAVAASRPVVDAGVAPYDRQVGISGRIVRPRLYIACGISGSVHHVAGMKESGAVVAINPDPYAPMMQLADLAVVGDAREIVPALLAALASGCSGHGETDRLLATRSDTTAGVPA